MQLTDGEVRYGAEGIAETLTVSVESGGAMGRDHVLAGDGAGALQSRHCKLEGSGPTLGDWGKASAETGPVEVTAELAESTAHVYRPGGRGHHRQS